MINLSKKYRWMVFSMMAVLAAVLIFTPVGHAAMCLASGTESGTALDGMMERTTSYFTTIVKFVGGLAFIVGIIIAAVGFMGHDNEKKLMGVSAIVVGGVIFFAPEIKTAILGK